MAVYGSDGLSSRAVGVLSQSLSGAGLRLDGLIGLYDDIVGGSAVFRSSQIGQKVRCLEQATKSSNDLQMSCRIAGQHKKKQIR